MVPSGNTRQVSRLSCGTFSARYGTGRPASLRITRPALNIRPDRSAVRPSDRNGFAVRLGGSARVATTSVLLGWADSCLAGAAPVLPLPGTAAVGPAQALITST